MARMNPQLQQRAAAASSSSWRTRASATARQAYNDAMGDYQQQANDARFGAIAQAGQEQQRMDAMAAQRAAFQNAAQQQGYEQKLGQRHVRQPGRRTSNSRRTPRRRRSPMPAWRSRLAQEQAGFNAAEAAAKPVAAGAVRQAQPADQRDHRADERHRRSAAQFRQHAVVADPDHRLRRHHPARFPEPDGALQHPEPAIQALIGGVLGLGAGALKLSDAATRRTSTASAPCSPPTTDGASARSCRSTSTATRTIRRDAPHRPDGAGRREDRRRSAVEEHEGVKYIRPRQVMGSIIRAA